MSENDEARKEFCDRVALELVKHSRLVSTLATVEANRHYKVETPEEPKDKYLTAYQEAGKMWEARQKFFR